MAESEYPRNLVTEEILGKTGKTWNFFLIFSPREEILFSFLDLNQKNLCFSFNLSGLIEGGGIGEKGSWYTNLPNKKRTPNKSPPWGSLEP